MELDGTPQDIANFYLAIFGKIERRISIGTHGTHRPETLAKFKVLAEKYSSLVSRPSVSSFLETEIGRTPSGDEGALFRRLAHLGQSPRHGRTKEHYHENQGLMRRCLRVLEDGAFHSRSSLIEALNVVGSSPRGSISRALMLPIRNGYVTAKPQTIGATREIEPAFQLTPLGIEWMKRVESEVKAFQVGAVSS